MISEEPRHIQELAALYTVSAAMMRAANVEQALSQGLSQVLQVLDLEGGKVYLLDQETQQLALSVAQGSEPVFAPDEAAALRGCLCAPTVASGELLPIPGPMDALYANGESYRQHQRHRCAAVPLLTSERPLGILYVQSSRTNAFEPAELAVLRAIGAQIGVVVENIQLREQAQRAETLSTLIQEMHHRIKNNLQTVADLLGLEMSASPSPAARKSLRDSISRIKSIAAVHELLSLEQLRLTDITALAREVCDISLHHLVRPNQRVKAEVAGPVIYLPSKQATALALVINELISNAVEHAFDPTHPGSRLTITTAQDGAQVIVTVADNGRGLSPDFDRGMRRGMGLQIVQTLVEKDLAGSLRLQNAPEGGTRVTLTFYK